MPPCKKQHPPSHVVRRQRPFANATLLPLGALAAGFGLCSLSAFAQVADPKQSTEDAKDGRPTLVAAETLPGVEVTGTREKDANSLRATTTTIGKSQQDIRDIPQSVTVVTEKMIEDLKLNSLKDALHYTAGISFSATENGTDQEIRLRGFPIATTGDLMIDGMRDPSQYERDTFDFERVEVMRGSASMLFGRGSTGGVVNQVTKKPELLDQTDVLGSIGSRGYFRTTVDLNTRLDETSAFRLNLMETKATNDGPRTDKHGIAPTYRFGIGTQDEFTVGVFYINVNNIPQASIRWLNNGPGTQGTLAPIDPENFYGTNSDYQKGKASYGTVSNVHRFDDGGRLDTQLRTGVYDRQTWSTAAGFGAAPLLNPVTVTASNIDDHTVLTRAGLTPRKDRYVNTYFQSTFEDSYEWLGLRHEIIGGVDAAKEQAKRFQNNAFLNPLGTRPNTTVGTPDDGTTLRFAPIFRDSSNYTARALGAFVQDLVQIAPSWKLLGGVRYDSFKGDFRTLAYSSTTGALTSTSSAHIANSPWSYRGGVLLQPSTTASFHASYGTSFNTAADTYQYVTQQTANTPPEKSRNIEVGAKLDWFADRLSTRVAIFRTDKFNERTTDADFAGTSFLLSGQRHTQGIELDVAGRITKDLEVFLSASYVPTAIIDRIGSAQAAVIGQRVGLTPRTTGGAYLSYTITPALRVGAGVHGASKNYALQGTTGAAQNTNRAPGYAVADLLVEYRFTPDLFAQFNLLNVKNKLYGDQLYPAFATAGQPRTAQLTLATRF